MGREKNIFIFLKKTLATSSKKYYITNQTTEWYTFWSVSRELLIHYQRKDKAMATAKKAAPKKAVAKKAPAKKAPAKKAPAKKAPAKKAAKK